MNWNLRRWKYSYLPNFFKTNKILNYKKICKCFEIVLESILSVYWISQIVGRRPGQFLISITRLQSEASVSWKAKSFLWLENQELYMNPYLSFDDQYLMATFYYFYMAPLSILFNTLHKTSVTWNPENSPSESLPSASVTA